MILRRGTDSTSDRALGRPGAARPRLAAVILTAVIAAAAIGWLARAPYTPGGGEAALVRLSWRLRGEAAETCRPRTEAELIALPQHMRTPEICERRPVAYYLIVQLDDGPVDTSRVVSGGVKGDRPVFILRDSAVAPGAHRVVVRFEQVGDGGETPLLRLAIDTVLHVYAGTINLITLDHEARRLVHRAP